MNDAPADLIHELLLDLLLAHTSVTDWEVFTGYMPDQPNKAICVYDTAGRLDGRIMRTGEQIVHPGIMILLRSDTYPEGYNQIKEIANQLDLVCLPVLGRTVILNSTAIYTLQNISRTGDIHPLGMMEDDRKRFHFSINAVLTLRKES
jgi:hypothetical protein